MNAIKLRNNDKFLLYSVPRSLHSTQRTERADTFQHLRRTHDIVGMRRERFGFRSTTISRSRIQQCELIPLGRWLMFIHRRLQYRVSKQVANHYHKVHY
jgi:hypothetical protein